MMDVANIDLPYVETNRSRHGAVRYYLRMDGRRVTRLPDKIDSEEFSRKYWEARKQAEAERTERTTTARPLHLAVKAGSFQWLCMAYMRSSAFTSLDRTTQARRRSIIEAMWDEPMSKTDQRRFAEMPYSRMDAGNIAVLRDRKADTPFAADERLKVLRQVFDTVDPSGKPYAANHARLVDPFRRHSDGHATATPADLEAFIRHHGVGSKAVFYLSIAMYTGLRVSDLAQLGPQHRRGDEFRLRLFKNRNRTPVDLVIAIHPILDAVVKTNKTTALTYLLTEYGKPFSVKGLGNRVSEWFRQAGLPHLTSHSVRKGLATDVAHNEATDSMMEAMFGWRDAKTSKIYTRNAERARLARQTVARINWDGIGSRLVSTDEVSQGVAGCGSAD